MAPLVAPFPCAGACQVGLPGDFLWVGVLPLLHNSLDEGPDSLAQGMASHFVMAHAEAWSDLAAVASVLDCPDWASWTGGVPLPWTRVPCPAQMEVR